MSSLGGQNNPRRWSGARSSRASSAIFYKLRELDEKIRIKDIQIKIWTNMGSSPSNINKLIKERIELDEKRKQTRLKRKGYET